MDLPARFAALADGASRLVWTNDLGGHTWALGGPVQALWRLDAAEAPR